MDEFTKQVRCGRLHVVGIDFLAENLAAVLLCLAVLAIIIFTADQAPQWIYQGF